MADLFGFNDPPPPARPAAALPKPVPPVLVNSFDKEVARARKKWSTAKGADAIKTLADIFDGQHEKARLDLLAMIRRIPGLPPLTDKQIQHQVEDSVGAWKDEAAPLAANIGDQHYPCPFDKTLSTAVGFPKFNGTINPFLPTEARPVLTKNEASAASIYSDDCYAALNDLNRAEQTYFIDERTGRATVGRKIKLTAEEAAQIGPPKYAMKLSTGAGEYIQPPGVIAGYSMSLVKIPPGAKEYKTKPDDPDTWPKGHAEVFREVESAINKTKRFEKPIKITRGLWFNKNFSVDVWYEAWHKKKLIPQNGFNSCATTGTPEDFAGTGELIMAVKQGLDLTPYSKTPNECELLLQHGTLLLVRKIEPPQPSTNPNTKYKIFVEQILLKEGARDKWAKLDKGASLDEEKHDRMATPEFDRMMGWSRAKLWRSVQAEVRRELDKLRSAYPYAGKQRADVEAAHDKKMALFDRLLNDELGGIFDKLDNESDETARKQLIAESVQCWNAIADPVRTSGFLGELDANPFVRLSIRRRLNAAADELNLLKF